MLITFTNTLGVPEEFKPQTASTFVPDWYKEMDSYVDGEKKPSGSGQTTGTIKRCMPVFDAITGGYIIPTYVDVFVSQKPHLEEDGKNTIMLPHYQWPSFNPIQWHTVDQAPTHPNRNGHQYDYPKWINSWAIQTPPGYSTLFMQPVHRKADFTILTGIVDTDQYNAPVNFPFVLNDISFSGLIPAGTPMAQVIPFKRDSWEMALGDQAMLESQNKTAIKLRTRIFDSYKSQYRQAKEYR